MTKFINTGERATPRRQPPISEFQHEIIEVSPAREESVERGEGNG